MRSARTHGMLEVVRLSRSCLMSSVCTTVCNKSKLTVTEAHTISLHWPSSFLHVYGTTLSQSRSTYKYAKMNEVNIQAY